MGSQFDDLAQMYEDMFALPWRRHVESYTVLELLGDFAGMQLLDIGCGSGLYSRLLRRAGAARVVGYDTSTGMIDYARGRERTERLGIEYASEPDPRWEAAFDTVLGVYVIPYATTYGELARLCRMAAGALRPGGRWLTLPVHPTFHEDRDHYARYGFRIYDVGTRGDGTPVTLELCFGGYRQRVQARYWPRVTLERAIYEAGFTALTWYPFHVSPAGVEEFGEAFWRPYLSCPHAAIIDCRC